MKKKVLVAVLAVAAVAAMTLCTACSGSSTLRFVTGGETGTYYAVGNQIANHATNTAKIEVKALSSDGSKANVQSLSKKDAELAFCQSDVMAYAYTGTNIFDGTAITNFRTLGALYMEQVQIVTCDPNIKTVADLKGKKVSIGAAGSGVYFNAIDILGAYDLTESDITPTYQSFGDSADALKNGQIDAAFVVAGAPTTAITDLSTSKQAYLVSLDAAHIAKLILTCDYYKPTVITAGTYKGIDNDVATVAVAAVVLVGQDVAEDTVYKLTADLFDNLSSFEHAKFKEMSVEFAASITSVPYHTGAAKYFAEKGYTVTSSK